MFHNIRPNEAEVQKIMRETGMDYMQAYNHVKSRIIAQSLSARPAAVRR